MPIHFVSSQEEEAHYMRLVSILHDILLSDAKSSEKKEELQRLYVFIV